MGTEMFHFPTSPPTRLYIHPVVTTHNTQRGFPIRTPSDHSSFTNSPRLIADYRVLHRPLMPRHPPCALEHSPPHTNTHKPKSPYALQGDKTNNTRNTKTNKITTTTHKRAWLPDARVHYSQNKQPPHTRTTTPNTGNSNPWQWKETTTTHPTSVRACSPTTQQRACPHPHTTHKHSIHEHPEQHVSAEVSQCSTHEHPTHPPWMSGLTTTHPTTNHQVTVVFRSVSVCVAP